MRSGDLRLNPIPLLTSPLKGEEPSLSDRLELPPQKPTPALPRLHEAIAPRRPLRMVGRIRREAGFECEAGIARVASAAAARHSFEKVAAVELHRGLVGEQT